MKYTLNLKSNIEVPNNTKWVLFYTRRDGINKVYALSDILSQNNRYMKAEIIGEEKGIRTFLNKSIITLQKV